MIRIRFRVLAKFATGYEVGEVLDITNTENGIVYHVKSVKKSNEKVSAYAKDLKSVITGEALDDSSKENLAYILGIEAFRNGKPNISGRDKNLIELLKGAKVGQGELILKAWNLGFIEAPIKEDEEQEYNIRLVKSQIVGESNFKLKAKSIEEAKEKALTNAENNNIVWNEYTDIESEDEIKVMECELN